MLPLAGFIGDTPVAANATPGSTLHSAAAPAANHWSEKNRRPNPFRPGLVQDKLGSTSIERAVQAVAIMDINQRKEQFSRAYVLAVASAAGYAWYQPSVDDDSIDL